MKSGYFDRFGSIGGIKDRLTLKHPNSEKHIEDQLRGYANDDVLCKTLQNVFMRFGEGGSFSDKKHIIERDFENGSKQFDLVLRLDENEIFATDLVISFNWQNKKDRKAGIKKGLNIFVNNGLHRMDSGNQFTLSDGNCMVGEPRIKNFDALLNYLNSL